MWVDIGKLGSRLKPGEAKGKGGVAMARLPTGWRNEWKPL